MISINTESAMIYGETGVANYYINDSGGVEIIEDDAWPLSDLEYLEAMQMVDALQTTEVGSYTTPEQVGHACDAQDAMEWDYIEGLRS